MKGLGFQAVREKIEQAFRSVHNDQRTREERKADEELRVAVSGDEESQTDREILATLESSHVSRENMKKRVDAYVSAALRSPEVVKHTPRRNNVGNAWLIEVPSEDADTLIAQAMRQTEE